MIDLYSRQFLIEKTVETNGNIYKMASDFGYFDATVMRRTLARRGISRIKKPGKPLIILVKGKT